MAGGGSKKGERRGGRQKGSRNKATVARVALVAAGIDPLTVMLENMRHAYDMALASTGKQSEGHRVVAQERAKDAAPYCHPKLVSSEQNHNVKGTVEHVVTDEDRAKALAVFLAKNNAPSAARS